MSILEDYIDQATQNVREDRAATKALLMSVMKFLQVSDDRHKEVGLVAAKYLETLQRSNEQLVKLASLLQRDSKTGGNMSEKDKQELFDIIQGGDEDE